MKNKYIFYGLLLAVSALAILASGRFLSSKDVWLCQDGEWVRRGNPATPIPLEGCGDEETVIRSDDEFNEEDLMIRNLNVTSNQRIQSPFILQGEARGLWFFEATFPIFLTDADGLVIAQWYATAQAEWMTEDFVPFEADFIFESPPSGSSGYLILQKANPSGLPEYEMSIPILVQFGE